MVYLYKERNVKQHYLTSGGICTKKSSCFHKKKNTMILSHNLGSLPFLWMSTSIVNCLHTYKYCRIIRFHGGSIFVNFVGTSIPKISNHNEMHNLLNVTKYRYRIHIFKSKQNCKISTMNEKSCPMNLNDSPVINAAQLIKKHRILRPQIFSLSWFWISTISF